jgi:NADH:ubiquinone oxidoreductase subunit 6 (subunit J)
MVFFYLTGLDFFFLFLYYSIFFLLVICILFIYLFKQETIYSVLALTAVFILSAFLLVLVNIKFLAFTFIIVYVGAVVLLFVFVVFMVGPSLGKGYSYSQDYTYFIQVFIPKVLSVLFIGLVDFIEYFFVLQKDVLLQNSSVRAIDLKEYSSDIFIFSSLLYTEHFFLFFLVSIILLVAMVGSIVLCLNKK